MYIVQQKSGEVTVHHLDDNQEDMEFAFTVGSCLLQNEGRTDEYLTMVLAYNAAIGSVVGEVDWGAVRDAFGNDSATPEKLKATHDDVCRRQSAAVR